MSQIGTIDVRPGVRVWWQGAVWLVDVIDADGVLLRRDGHFQRVALAQLVDGLRALGAEPEQAERDAGFVGAIALSSLSPAARAVVESNGRAIATLLKSDGP